MNIPGKQLKSAVKSLNDFLKESDETPIKIVGVKKDLVIENFKKVINDRIDNDTAGELRLDPGTLRGVRQQHHLVRALRAPLGNAADSVRSLVRLSSLTSSVCALGRRLCLPVSFAMRISTLESGPCVCYSTT